VADSTFLSQTGAYLRAVEGIVSLAGCIMHLFKSGDFVPSPLTPKADFLAAECDFDGYAPNTIAAWSDPPVLAGSSWSIYAPTQTFRYTFSDGVANSVGGYFLVTAGGDLYGYVTFNPAENAAAPGQAIIRTPLSVYPWG
jgi:hypothetical protein